MQGGVSSRVLPSVETWTSSRLLLTRREGRDGGFKVSRSVILFHWSSPPVWPEPGVSLLRMLHRVAGDWGMLFARAEVWVWEPLRGGAHSQSEKLKRGGVMPTMCTKYSSLYTQSTFANKGIAWCQPSEFFNCLIKKPWPTSVSMSHSHLLSTSCAVT